MKAAAPATSIPTLVKDEIIEKPEYPIHSSHHLYDTTMYTRPSTRLTGRYTQHTVTTRHALTRYTRVEAHVAPGHLVPLDLRVGRHNTNAGKSNNTTTHHIPHLPSSNPQHTIPNRSSTIDHNTNNSISTTNTFIMENTQIKMPKCKASQDIQAGSRSHRAATTRSVLCSFTC